jgi:hypothetical protein
MVQGHPIRVAWAGWESDTYTLTRSGWSIATQESYQHNELHLMLHHKGLGMTGYGRIRGYMDLLQSCLHDSYRGTRDLDHVVIQIETLASTKDVFIQGRHPVESARWVDGEPYLMRIENKPLRNLSLFRQLDAPAPQELITEPETVQELLDKILAMQGPMRKELRAREARRERDAPAPRRIHAQIVSLAA